MRKSTLVVLVILAVALVGLTFAMKYYTDQFAEEIAHARVLTKEFRDEQHALAPESNVRLARVAGGAKYIVHDTSTYGLLLEAAPNAETWKSDARGRTIAAKLAARLFDLYTVDRPIQWIQFRLTKSDGSELPVFGLARGNGESIVPVEPEASR